MAFKDFCKSVSLEEVLSTHSKLNSHEIIDKILKSGIFEINFNKDEKCNKISENFRIKGNGYFNSNDKDLKNIYLTYTKALYYASTKKEKSFCYGNRSGVLFRMGSYSSCIKDINSAVACDYPRDKMYKLWLRKAEALIMLGDFEDAQQYLDDCKNIIDSQMPMIDLWHQKVNVALSKCIERRQYDTLLPNIDCVHNYPSKSITISGKNVNIASFSDKVRLCASETEGRCVLACCDIDIGETIAVETPHTYRLCTDSMMTHCYYCLQHNTNLMPCDHCCHVGFCNEQCQLLAKTLMRHDLECGIMPDILSTYSNELGLLAYGIISRTKPDTVQSALDLPLNKDSDDIVIDSQDYRSVLAIETNEHCRSVYDLGQRCTSAVFLAHCLVKMLFTNEDKLHRQHWLSIFSRALVHHLQGIPCNAHSLGEHTTPLHGSLIDSSTNYIGSGLYPGLSMINHACSPNVLRITMAKGVCVLRACSPIAKGSQIFDNYSVHFATMAKADRLQQLRQQYHFHCHCVACKDNWPQFDTQLRLDNTIVWLCRCCMGIVDWPVVTTCVHCHASLATDRYRHLQSLIDRLAVTMDLVLQHKLDGVELYLVQLSALLAEMVKAPNIVFHQAAEMLKLLWTLQGSVVSSF